MAWTRGWGIVAMLAAVLAGCGDSGGGSDADGDGAVETDGEPEVEPGDDGGETDGGPRCGNGVVEAGEECDDGNSTPGDGCEDCLFDCHDPAECDDGLDCTRDACEVVATGLLCVHRPVAGACVIAGSCHAESDLEPGNPCHVCAPATDPEGWSSQAEGTSCADDLFCNGTEACSTTGACVALEPGCPADPCVASCDETADSCVPASADTVCRPAVGDCDFEEKCDGTTWLCPADEIVAAGWICRAGRGPCDPEEICAGDGPACPADDVLTEGTSCDDLDACSLASACDAAGVCAGTSFPAPGMPRPFLPQNGVVTGSPYAPAGFNTLRPRFRWQDSPRDGCPTPAYDLQIDDSCTSAGFEACAFPSPEAGAAAIVGIIFAPPTDLPVSTTAPVGRRYYWRMRACRGAACSAWTPVRYLDVGRAPQDFNGDGYSDVVVGSPFAGSGSVFLGAAYLYAGSPTGIDPSAPVPVDNPAPQANALFGWSVASAGDLNADGYADLVVGAPSQDAPEADEGNVFVFLGSATGPSATPMIVLDDPLDEIGADFGRSVAGAGDVDGDGFADLLVGAPGTDGATLDDGAAYLFYGSSAGTTSVPDVTLADRDGEPGGAFGAAVATAGDLNADGFADLVVGEPLADFTAVDEGRAWVFLGSATGPSTATALRLDDPGNQAGAHFGGSVATAGDIRVNGNSELLVGAAGQSNPAAGEGNIFIYYYDMAAGVPTTPSGVFDNPLDQAGASEGVAAGVGDVNHDSYSDVIVGAWLEDNPEVDEGTAYLYHGCSCGVIRTATPTVTLDDPRDGADDRFATSVSGAGDVNGDGFADVVVGSPGPWGVPFLPGGEAYVYLGSAASIPTDPSTTIPDPIMPALVGGFGMSVE